MSHDLRARPRHHTEKCDMSASKAKARSEANQNPILVVIARHSRHDPHNIPLAVQQPSKIGRFKPVIRVSQPFPNQKSHAHVQIPAHNTHQRKKGATN